MAVHHALNVRPFLVDLEVQQGLAGSLFDPRSLLACHVHRANVLGLEEAFAVHSRSAEHFVFADANGDVAIVGGRESFVVKATADFTDVLLDLVWVH